MKKSTREFMSIAKPVSQEDQLLCWPTFASIKKSKAGKMSKKVLITLPEATKKPTQISKLWTEWLTKTSFSKSNKWTDKLVMKSVESLKEWNRPTEWGKTKRESSLTNRTIWNNTNKREKITMTNKPTNSKWRSNKMMMTFWEDRTTWSQKQSKFKILKPITRGDCNRRNNSGTEKS